jgi:two-component system, NarL family, nitrate/nitrite response regulator NarL
MIRILLADDHSLFRAGLRRVLEAEGDFLCDEAATGEETVAKVRQLPPDVLLLDVSMPGVSGLDALRDLAGATETTVLLLTGSINEDEMNLAIQLGARGVVMKDSPPALLIKALRTVLRGEYWVGRETVTDVVNRLRRPPSHREPPPQPDRGLTSRELMIVAGVVAAFGNRDIAQALHISEKTVKQHLTNVFDKLGVSSRVELAMFALRHGLRLPDFPPDS